MFFDQVFILLCSITGTLTLNVPQGRLLRKQRDHEGAENPFLIPLSSDFTPQDSVMSASQDISKLNPGSDLLRPMDTITFASLESISFLLQLDGVQKFDDSTLEKKLGPLVNDINRYIARTGLENSVTVSTVVDLWMPSNSQLSAMAAFDKGDISAESFTTGCALALGSVIVSLVSFVLGLLVAIPSSVQKGLKEWTGKIVKYILQSPVATRLKAVLAAIFQLLKAGNKTPSAYVNHIIEFFKVVVSVAGPKSFVAAITKYVSFWTKVYLVAQLVIQITAIFASGTALLVLKILGALVGVLPVIDAFDKLFKKDQVDRCFG